MHMFSCLGYFLYSVHTTVSARVSKSIQNLNFPNTMYEFQAQMHWHVHTQFANWILDVHNKFKKKHKLNELMCISHGDQGGQLQSRCTKVHTHTHQHTMRCIHAPLVHSCTVLIASLMSACAMQRAYSLMHIHVRLESTHQIQIVNCIQELCMQFEMQVCELDS